MPRRRRVDLHVNHERWLVSYADFITLLFAFFVVMYSISQVNESKYRVLSETLVDAFSDSVATTINPIQVGDPSRSSDPSVIDLPAQVENPGEERTQGQPGDGAFEKTAELPQLSDLFEDQFADLIDDELIQVHSNELWLEIELKSSILFNSADAEPSAEAENIFGEMAGLLKDWDNPIQVEGFTDDIPIRNGIYLSNWELSTARASSVVKLLMSGGVEPQRLAAVGYGEHQPIASNETPEGRQKNRRVVLMVSREKAERPRLADEEALDRAVNPPLVETSEPFPETGLVAPENLLGESLLEESLVEEGIDGEAAEETVATQEESADRLAPVGEIKPVETESGGLLFSSDPDLPRQ